MHVVNQIIRIFQTTLKEFQSSEFSVVREHEEFVWLHDRYVENEEYAGIIVSFHISFDVNLLLCLTINYNDPKRFIAS